MTGWVRRHQAGLWRYLRFLGCPADLASDVMQDALLAALAAKIHETRPDPVARRWLRSTASNLFRSQLRRAARRPERELLPELEADAAWRAHVGSPEHGGLSAGVDGIDSIDGVDGDGTTYVMALRSCLRQLEPRQRRVIEMRYGEDASRQAMARELEISQEGVKTMLRRLRDTLRRCVEGKIGRTTKDQP